MQSKYHSVLETVANILVGFVTSVIINAVAMPIIGIKAEYSQMGLLALVFTVWAVIRMYVIRRIFNRITHGTK